jgi:hypothetical protein
MLAPSRQSSHRLRLGGISKSDLHTQLRASGVHLNDLAIALIMHDDFQPLGEKIELTVFQNSVAELGLMHGGSFKEVAAGALALGYSLCPPETAIYLRLTLRDQPEGFIGRAVTHGCAPPGSITVASAPISEDEEVPKGFYLRVIEGAPWLRGYRSWSGHVWAPNDVFAFVGPSGAA